MRNVVVALRHHRRVSLLRRIVALRDDKTIDFKLGEYISRGKDNGLSRQTNTWVSPFCLQQRTYSTGFTSVHGGIPTAEYAKLRRESLETEFGHALGAYSSKSFSAVYRFGPFLALYRAAIISYHVVKLAFWQLFVQDMRKRAVKFRETLISLGPFYIKLGQALSTRPDILPSIYCQELSKLQDQIPPFPTTVAMRCIEEQLGAPVSKLFADISLKPVAAASLGQVYKAHLHSGQLVAVKVQRPGMSIILTRDALLFKMIGGQLKRFAKARKDLLVAVNEMVRHMFDEIDYVLEAKNAERFASLYSFDSGNEQINVNDGPRNKSRNHRAENIKVPKIYWKFTRTAVLTMEWIDGIKLTDEIKLKGASLDRRDLIDQGLSCSLKQLLEVGFFHADPHPGNLVATKEGSLVYFDFGMMGNIPRHYRVGLIQILVHFVNRDSLSLANDFLSLGFLPEGVDIQAVSNALRSSFGSTTRISQDFQGVMEQLYDVMYEFNFSLPPDYALVIRSLGSLEGTAKILDPEFKVIESAYPFVIGRLLADPSPDMRKILRELVICNDGSIRWNRLERLVAAISEQASATSGDSPEDKTLKKSSELKSFDMHSVVSATEDLLLFILSEKGQRVRVFLLQDIIRVVDIFLEEEALDLNTKKKQTINLKREERTMNRVSNGFKCLNEAVKLAPGMWISMLLRMSKKSEVHNYALDIVSALSTHFGHKSFAKVREEEISVMMEKVEKASSDSSPLNLSKLLITLTSDVTSRVSFGRKHSNDASMSDFKNQVRKITELVGGFPVSEYIPCLAWIDHIRGLYNKAEQVSKTFGDLMDKVVQEHLDSRDKPTMDLVDILLSLERQNKDGIEIRRSDIKFIILNMFLGGTTSTSSVLEWTMTELIRHPECMKKLQDEIRGDATKLNIYRSQEEVEDMKYLKAVIKEGLRLHPPFPVIVRQLTEDVKLKEYDIPAGPQVIINVWAIQRDIVTWGMNAEEFRPERHLDSPLDFRGTNFEFIPFGSGRRICPGIGFATALFEVTLANLVNRFNWRMDVRFSGDEYDLAEASGIEVGRKFPLIVFPSTA
ncbi:Protein kinase-like domain superfamily [Arabidopsis thaliana x Arabidopsis arenosa]|uniref:Protein kinase-like domain superfamily n=1 Tax=Arabidopsis thaliana x Arabidopsis arenosa TaxID=1240361 RepID=A0A8T1Z0M1_9BRAS|nr:Protein kinase-like domain superfamily [Arabidopsis thaliana x Arabidopsis arenosa]